jgi:hypothetical protein
MISFIKNFAKNQKEMNFPFNMLLTGEFQKFLQLCFTRMILSEAMLQVNKKIYIMEIFEQFKKEKKRKCHFAL